MKNKKWPLSARIFICIGLLMVTLPSVLKEYLYLPHFFRGFLTGFGLVLEIYGIVLLLKFKKREQAASQ